MHENSKTMKMLISALVVASGTQATLKAQTAQPYQGTIGRTLAESKEWWPEPAKAPAGDPNVVWILIDDVGYGAAGSFGGLINTPTFDNLSNNGLRYTNFHTTAICAPTRSALLTGRNSASVHESGFSHTIMSAGFPGWDGRVPATAGTIAEILRDNGYNTFAVGKYGITPDEEATDAGPFDPTKRSSISIARRRLLRTSRSSSTTRLVRRMRRTRWISTGATNTRASSTKAGTFIAKRSSSGRRSSA
jgi:arylsulfatase A-like enzyme